GTGNQTVTVNYTNAAGCTATSPFSYGVVVNSLPNPTLNGNNPVCVGSTGNVYTTQGSMGNYVWNITGGTITAGGNSTSNTATVTWNTVGSQSISVNYAQSGCPAASPAVYNVTVNPRPAPSISGPASICEGTTTGYKTQTGMSGYTWTVSSGGTIINGSGTDSITVTWATAGSKTVTVNYANSFGCQATSPTSYAVTVNALPSPSITGTAATCIGSSLTYSTQTGMTGYAWTVSSGGTITGGLGTSSITVNWTGTGNQTVTVNYTNAAGCTATSPLSYGVTVNPLPNPTVSGLDSLCINSSGIVYTTQAGMQNYTWTITGGTIISGGTATSNTATVAWTSAGIQNIGINYLQSGCPATLPFSLPVHVHPLPVADAGTDFSINVGTGTILDGSGSSLGSYLWNSSPLNMIKSGGATIHPTTENLFSPTQFEIQVTSDKGCLQTDQVTVSVHGSLLGVQCNVNPDTICNDGANANLIVVGSGGGGSYSYQWASSPGSFISTLANPVVSPTITTVYTVTVTDGFTSVTCQANLIVKSLPPSFIVTGGGKYCAGGTGVEIGLASSSSQDTYVLQDQLGNTVGSKPGTGDPIIFGTYTTPGIYKAVATSITLPHCTKSMTDSAVVEVIPLPATFSLTGGGSFSAGGTGVPVGLSGSEPGVEYELWKNGSTPVIPRRPGTGFSITFGNQTTAGFYTVKAYTLTTPVCNSEMMDTVEVIVNPWPVAFSVTGGGEYCFGGEGVPVGLSGSEIGVKYYLRIGNGTVLDSLPGTGDVLDFGLQTLGGVYTVKGVNTTSGLATMMTGQATVIVNPLPLPYLMVPQGDTCFGTELLLNGSQAGVEYYLLRGTDTVKMVMGSGTFGLLTFGHVYDSGTFRSVAHNPLTGCWNDMTGSVTLQPAPEVYRVMPPGILCPGQSVILIGSQVGINYQLRRDSLINVGSPLPGTGNALDFGPQYLPGKYRVVATNPLTHCYSWLDGDATIQPSPTVYNILPSGDTCAPATVRLNGSQIGISYRLVFNGIVYLDSLYGTGQPLVFGTYTTAGLYQIRAIDTLTHCEYWMNDSLFIEASPLPYNIIPNGIACAGMEVGLDDSESGVDYYLIRDGWILAGGPVPGTGNAITFGIQSTPGTYTVNATRTLTGCDAVMNGNAQLSPLPQAFLIAPQGDQCAGTELWLNGSQLGVTYQLFRDSILQATLNGTGSMLNFGPQYLPGVYTIKGADNLTTCDTLMGGSVTIQPGPERYTVTPAGINCIPATIGLSGSDVGVIYQLRRNGSVNVGSPVPGTGSALSFGLQTLPGYYSIIATDTGTDCYSWMLDSAFIQPPAIVYNVVPSGDTCMGAIIRLNGSEPGKEYILVLNGTIYLDTLVGTGPPIVFGTYTTTGVYRIIARDVVAGCKTPMSDSLRILDSPVSYNMFPNGIGCAGMEVGLDDSDPSVNYTLIRDNATIAAGPVPGTGGR
ncbi:MAG TPA: hypothetical protein PKG48_11625, partial [Bacteroidales bacterium]|nr:hypothetical protein [Bacteroidales bacterium]